MATAITVQPTFADLLRPASLNRALTYDVTMVFLGSMLIAATAQLIIPLGFSPVPITGQTFGVLLVGALLGSRRGAAAAALYLAEGAMGMPVFAGGSFGVLAFAGPTAGYLIGFVPAAYLIGRLAERKWDRSFIWTAAAMALATSVIFVCGLAWLFLMQAGVAWLAGSEAALSPLTLLTWGLWFHLPGALLKIMLAAALLPSGWKVLQRVGALGPRI